MRLARAEWVALLLAVLVGVWLTAGVWLSPLRVTVDTHFTDGHLAGASLAGRGLWSGELWRLHTVQAGWPEGVMFRPLLWPIMLLAGVTGPVLALNLSWALAPAASALGGLLLGRTLSLSPWGRASLGLLLAWCTWNRVTLANGQIEQAGLGAIAVVWAGALWAESGPAWRLLAAPAVLLAVGLAAPNCGLAAALGMGLLAAGRVLQSPARLPRYLAVLGLSVGAALLIHGYHAPNYSDAPNFFQPRLRPPSQHDPSNYGIPSGWLADVTQQLDDADVRSLLVPAGPAAYSSSPVQHVPFLGGTLMLGAVLGIWRRRQAWPLLGVALGMAVLALGDDIVVRGQRFLLPYALIDWLAPSAASSGSAYRLAMAAIVGLAAVLSAGLDPKTARQRLLLGALVAMAWAETTLLPGPAIPLPTRDVVHHPALRALAGQDGPLLDLPLPLVGSCDAQTARYFNGTLAHGRPLLHTLAAGPNFQDRTEDIRDLHRLFRASTCPEQLPGVLGTLGVTAVVLHTGPPREPSPALRACLSAALGEPEEAPGVCWWTLPD